MAIIVTKNRFERYQLVLKMPLAGFADRSALAGLESGVLLVDHVNATFAPDDAAVLVSPLE
jgi:hypothetical protein